MTEVKAQSDIVLTFGKRDEGTLWDKIFTIRIASTKEEAGAKVLSENLVTHFTSIIKEEIVVISTIVPSRFKNE